MLADFRSLPWPPRSPLDVAVWLTLAMPIALLAGGTTADIVLSLIAVLFLLHSTLRRDWGWTKALWVKLALALWLYMMLRGALALHPADAVSRSAVWIRYPIFAAALAYGTLREGAARRILWWMVAGYAIFLTADNLLQYLTGVDVFGIPTFVMPSGEHRLTGPFGRPKSGIMLAWLFLPALLPLLMTTEGTLQRPVKMAAGIVFALLALLAVLLAGERMALLITLLGFALCIVLLPIPRRITGSIAILGLLAIAIVLYRTPALMDRHVDVVIASAKHIEATPYGQIWGSAVRIFADYPLFGVGPRHFRVYCPTPRYGSMENLQWRCNLHPHNLYMEAFVETGTVGGALFVAMIASLFIPIRRAWPGLRRDPIFLGLVITLIMRFWPLAVTTSFYANWFGATLWLAVGWALALTASKPLIFKE